MSQPTGLLRSLAAYREEAGYAAVGLLVAGALLGGLAWTRAPENPGASATSGGSGTMTFDYSAQVPASPAYQSTEVTSPQPVFRKLTDVVAVGYSYVGEPGTIAVSADLATSSGWKWSLPLAPAREVPDGEIGGSVTLNLNGIERRALAGTRAAGIDMGDVTIDVATEVTTGSGTWRPTMPLVLDSQKLTLAGDQSSLVVQQGGAQTAGSEPTANSLTLFGVSIGIWPARMLGLLLLLAGLALGLLVKRLPKPTPQEDSDAARHRHKDLIVPVTDVPMPRGPVVEVQTLDELAKVAQRYALLIFHWSDDAGDLYFVQDETAMYRCLVPRVREAAPLDQNHGP